MELVSDVKCKVYTKKLLASDIILTSMNTALVNLMGSTEFIKYSR